MIITQTLVDGVWVTQDPTDGQPYRKLMDGFAFETGTHSVVSADEEARQWRDQELSATDYIVPLTDHPQHDDYITYRTALRDWPSTESFPDTRPVLGE
jgi:hypothetical protein